jgi:hypothetical protein
MKKLLILLPAFALAQQNTSTVKVYEYVNGVRSITPNQEVVIKKDRIDIYDVKNGIKDLTPKETIINNKVYPVVNGIPSLFPTKEIEVTTPLFVF